MHVISVRQKKKKRKNYILLKTSLISWFVHHTHGWRLMSIQGGTRNDRIHRCWRTSRLLCICRCSTRTRSHPRTLSRRISRNLWCTRRSSGRRARRGFPRRHPPSSNIPTSTPTSADYTRIDRLSSWSSRSLSCCLKEISMKETYYIKKKK